MEPGSPFRYWIAAAAWLLTAALGLSRGDFVAPCASAEAKAKVKLDVPYEPSATEVVEEMLKIASVNPDDLVYDLGCGDGRIVITAAGKIGARGVGVDLDPERIRESIENARRAGVSDRVQFFRQDLFQTDIHEATVVMLYLWPEINLRLRPKLLRDLKPGTRVVSHSHDMGTWEADRMITASNGHRVYFWIVPANVSGTWTWSMPGPNATERWTLRLQQSFQKLSGTLLAETGERPLRDLELRGDSLRFTAEREIEGKIHILHFEGRVDGNRLEGMMEAISPIGASRRTWSAKRDPHTAVPWE